MAPRRSTAVETETTHSVSETNFAGNDRETPRPPRQIVWLNVYLIAALHLLALYGLYLIPSANPWTWFWSVLLFFWGGMGITVGAHRLWAHRTYKATWPLRVYLMIMNCFAAQNDIFEWARDHRVHHKYSETDADPHNAKRGFFFSHVGWLMLKKHPDVIKKGKQLDLSDLYEDKIVMFQRRLERAAHELMGARLRNSYVKRSEMAVVSQRHYSFLSILFNIVIPTSVPCYFWNETFTNAFLISFAFRYAFILNISWSVNSFAHMYGDKPYDETISPSENTIAILATVGEGYHNYHHVFPQDYAAAELGALCNASKWIIDACALVGLAYDLKTVSKEAILQRRMRTGDLQHFKHHDH